MLDDLRKDADEVDYDELGSQELLDVSDDWMITVSWDSLPSNAWSSR